MERCQICRRPVEGPSAVPMADESTVTYARNQGFALPATLPVCAECLDRFTKAIRELALTEADTSATDYKDTLTAAWAQIFVSEANLPVGVLDLGHMSGYNRIFLRDFDTGIVPAEYAVTTILKNLTLARRGDAIYHFRIRLTGLGDSVLITATGCAAQTGKVTSELKAAWQLLAPTKIT